MLKKLQLENKFLSSVRIRNGAGSILYIDGLPFGTADSSDYTIDIAEIIRRTYVLDLLHYHMNKLHREINHLTIDDDIMHYLYSYPRQGNPAAIYIVVANGLNTLDEGPATDLSEIKWHGLNCSRVEKCELHNATEQTTVEFNWLV